MVQTTQAMSSGEWVRSSAYRAPASEVYKLRHVFSDQAPRILLPWFLQNKSIKFQKHAYMDYTDTDAIRVWAPLVLCYQSSGNNVGGMCNK